MKSQKLFSLDTEVIDRLKKHPNASKLANDLFSDYFFSGKNLEKIELEELLIELKTKEVMITVKLTEVQEKINAIIQKESELKEIFEGLPAEILIDFQDFPKMTFEILKNRYTEIYAAKGVGWNELEKAYNEYFAAR